MTKTQQIQQMNKTQVQTFHSLEELIRSVLFYYRKIILLDIELYYGR